MSLLKINDNSLQPELQQRVQNGQRKATAALLGQLGPDRCLDHNLNACNLVKEMSSDAEFLKRLCIKENIDKIMEFATASTKDDQ